MHMKYFQGLARIRDQYDELVQHLDNQTRYGNVVLESWDIPITDREIIAHEREVLRYLIGCQLTLVRETNARKPSLDTVQRCFKRYLSYLERVHNCHAYNVNKHSSKLIQKEYKACTHYLFKFSLPAWYDKLPDEILTFENKYPKEVDLL